MKGDAMEGKDHIIHGEGGKVHRITVYDGDSLGTGNAGARHIRILESEQVAMLVKLLNDVHGVIEDEHDRRNSYVNRIDGSNDIRRCPGCEICHDLIPRLERIRRMVEGCHR